MSAGDSITIVRSPIFCISFCVSISFYAPTSDDVSKQLSEIERINIEMIRQIEKRHDENR